MSRTIRRRATTVIAAVFTAGLVGVFPAGAHNSSSTSHNWSQHYRAKADARYWRQIGNSNITPGTDFLGTTNDVAVDFRVNNLRALRLEPDPASPNVIGGFNGNNVTPGAHGATIGGGGSDTQVNVVTDFYGTVGGGESNRAGDNDANPTGTQHATVGGGSFNVAGGQQSTVAGGASNSASGLKSTIGGGQSNTATSTQATVAGGFSNDATNSEAFVGGGDSNTASGIESVIGGGNGNTASGSQSTVAGGSGNTASGAAATVGGGGVNLASGRGAVIAGGESAVADLHGQVAHGAGGFSATAGQAQTSMFVLRRQTTTATPAELFLDGVDDRLTVAVGESMSFHGLIVGRSSGGQSAGYEVTGLIENVGGVVSFVGAPAVTILGEDNAAWNFAVTADDGNDALVLTVTGATGATIRWVGTVRTSDVSV